MHLDPAAQLVAKADIVRESLRRVGRLDEATVSEIVSVGGAVDPFGYRTTIRVVGGPNGTLGYREERSDRVVPINSCPDRRVVAVSAAPPDRGRRGRRGDAAHQRGDRRDHRHLVEGAPQGDPRAAEHGAHRRAGVADRTNRRPRSARVGRLVLPIGSTGRRTARRRRPPRRSRAGDGATCGRRVRRCRSVRRHDDGRGSATSR